jgi:NADH-quinone oxidoreductase subunit L
VGGEEGPLATLVLAAEPAHVAGGFAGALLSFPGHGLIHDFHAQAGAIALLVAFGGTFLSYLFYGARRVDPAVIAGQFRSIHEFLVEKWQFDNLYDWMWVRPVHVVARWCQLFDKYVLDGTIHFLSWLTVEIARWDRRFDEAVVDRAVNMVGEVTFACGRALRAIQTGLLRQYIMFIAAGVVGLYVLLFIFLPR